MKSIKLIVIATLLILTISCNRDEEKLNQSIVTSISLNSGFPFLYGYAVDNAENVLYVAINDRVIGAALIKKINLRDMTELKSVLIPNVFIHGWDNLILTDANEIVTSFWNLTNGEQTFVRLSKELEIINSDAYNVSSSGTERMRLCNAGSGKLSSATNLFDSVGNNFMRYALMNSQGAILKTVDDTSSAYNELLIGSDYFQTTEGDFVYLCRNFVPPFYSSDLMIEKRDKDLNLVWRTKVDGPETENPSTAIEVGDKIYVYGFGTDINDNFKSQLIIRVFDQSGKLLDTKIIKSGALDDQTLDPLIPTEDGGFLLTGLTSLNTKPTMRKGILYKTDANLNVIKSVTYGGAAAVFNGGMIKTGANRYLLVYSDNSFAPDGNKYRLVLRYVDQNGDFIE